ncbi:cytochrome P450 [Streptomyces sp. 5-8]|uniref:Cytochrome P450 n=1 Tax=Streptomyces musisoli TaxID=2802280 RepID=A0ABS1P2Q9_9ACTN|nr:MULTISPECIES: cytochrome P450 [Streptomyces]MBL1106653.1 cytochrome P450 [Streptomyces musisoli]MBY8847082.1 cytochrome P450 [Streptomyces sp. SP2-10]
MHDTAFAADPHQVYDRLRAHGPAGPVELAPGIDATLVVGHETALRVLQNSTLFARDARRWKALNEGRIGLDHPVLPMMMYRPNCLFTDGAVHLRLRKAVTDSLARLNITRIRRDVEPIADYLIDQFSERGRADLLNDYAKLLPLLLFNKLFGCPADIGDTLTSSMSAIFDGKDALRANEELTACLMELIALKRRRPGDDVTSWLIQHPAGLTDEELKDQLVMLMGAGVEPERNLIGNALLLLLAPGAGGRDSGMLIEEAIDHVLWDQTPIANYATHYPVQDVDLGGVVAEANTPVVISFAAANSDPALAEARRTRSKGAHLAWGAGPHACPAKDPAQVIAVTAIEKILNALPDLTLAVHEKELEWRPGPFHRALATLPVAFSPTPATRMVAALQNRAVPAAAEQPARTAPAAAARQEPARKKGFWSTFLDIFRV